MWGGNVWVYCGVGWVWGCIEFWVFVVVFLWVVFELVGEFVDL